LEIIYDFKLLQSPDETSAKQFRKLVDQLKSLFTEFEEEDAREREALVHQAKEDYYGKVNEERKKVHERKSHHGSSRKAEFPGVNTVFADIHGKITPSSVVEKFQLKMEATTRTDTTL